MSGDKILLVSALTTIMMTWWCGYESFVKNKASVLVIKVVVTRMLEEGSKEES